MDKLWYIAIEYDGEWTVWTEGRYERPFAFVDRVEVEMGAAHESVVDHDHRYAATDGDLFVIYDRGKVANAEDLPYRIEAYDIGWYEIPDWIRAYDERDALLLAQGYSLSTGLSTRVVPPDPNQIPIMIDTVPTGHLSHKRV